MEKARERHSEQTAQNVKGVDCGLRSGCDRFKISSSVGKARINASRRSSGGRLWIGDAWVDGEELAMGRRLLYSEAAAPLSLAFPD